MVERKRWRKGGKEMIHKLHKGVTVQLEYNWKWIYFLTVSSAMVVRNCKGGSYRYDHGIN